MHATSILTDLAVLARMKGYPAIALINQGGTDRPYTAACLDETGRLSGPRAWDVHAEPEAALEDLFKRLART